jgi:hypothetical protein
MARPKNVIMYELETGAEGKLPIGSPDVSPTLATFEIKPASQPLIAATRTPTSSVVAPKFPIVTIMLPPGAIASKSVT